VDRWRTGLGYGKMAAPAREDGLTDEPRGQSRVN
jgi:hypothetical protein